MARASMSFAEHEFTNRASTLRQLPTLSLATIPNPTPELDTSTEASTLISITSSQGGPMFINVTLDIMAQRFLNHFKVELRLFLEPDQHQGNQTSLTFQNNPRSSWMKCAPLHKPNFHGALSCHVLGTTPQVKFDIKKRTWIAVCKSFCVRKLQIYKPRVNQKYMSEIG